VRSGSILQHHQLLLLHGVTPLLHAAASKRRIQHLPA
jgi:hypothetical protein